MLFHNEVDRVYNCVIIWHKSNWEVYKDWNFPIGGSITVGNY